ncbi:putative cystathionine gamma-lyase 2 [Atheta coriaria]|uniref:putative cystathionine gamma-lyase 2 n=1 Tax=Dalotia coriaria TaxID=877792 RepID=UPI0031F367FE
MDQPGYLPYPKGFSTRAIHVGQEPEKWDSMALVPPLVMSTTFKQYSPANFKEFEYGRSGNPSRNVLEECLASLENAKHAMCFSSGLAATNTLLGMFQSGDHVISGDDIYGGTYRLFSKVASKFGLEFSIVDTTDITKVEAAIKPNTKLIWLETPTNPCLKVNDIRAVAAIAKSRNVLLAVDNTFLTPYLQRPLELGADMSVYSLTKYMNGHSDVVMGAIVTDRTDLNERLRFLQNSLGAVPSPFDCSMVTRSLKTLAVRMRQHSANAIAVAKFLETHEKVVKVLHPGLPSHPHYELTKKQTSGHSGMVTVYLKGEIEQAKKFLTALKVFTLAESLGGYESLAELPSVMTHASVPPEQRKLLNITDNLVRLSVGLEDIEDLIADLTQALKQI